MQQTNNKVDNFECIYTTMALISIEIGGDEVLLELFRLALEIQVESYETISKILNLGLTNSENCATPQAARSNFNLFEVDDDELTLQSTACLV